MITKENFMITHSPSKRVVAGSNPAGVATLALLRDDRGGRARRIGPV